MVVSRRCIRGWPCHWETVGCGDLKEEGLGSTDVEIVLYSILFHQSACMYVSRKLKICSGDALASAHLECPGLLFRLYPLREQAGEALRVLGTLLILVVGLAVPWMALASEHGWSKIRGISLGWGGKCLRCCLGRVKRGGMPLRMNKC